MTGRTITIHGSDEVMATLSKPGTLYRGRWQDIKVTEVGDDEDTPLEVRKSLVGLTVPTIFSKEQLDTQGVNLKVPDNSRLSYAPDVIGVLRDAGKTEQADQLERVAPHPLDMYVFEEGSYEILE